MDTTQLDINRKKLYQKCAYNTHKVTKRSLDEILNKGTNYASQKLLFRLIDEDYKEYKCEICGITEWMNKKIMLQLHHIDGDRNNNCLENLKILCPNCHSQTDNFCGKALKSKKKEKVKINMRYKPPIKKPPISREELKDKIRNTPFTKIGKEFGVTDNTVRKWCDKHNLPRKVSVIKTYTDEEWKNV